MANDMLSTALNRDLALNCINWLSSDEDLISIRPKEPEDRKLDPQGSLGPFSFRLLRSPAAHHCGGYRSLHEAQIVWARKSYLSRLSFWPRSAACVVEQQASGLGQGQEGCKRRKTPVFVNVSDLALDAIDIQKKDGSESLARDGSPANGLLPRPLLIRPIKTRCLALRQRSRRPMAIACRTKSPAMSPSTASAIPRLPFPSTKRAAGPTSS